MKKIKILTILLIVFFISFIFIKPCFANTESSLENIDQLFKQGEDFITKGSDSAKNMEGISESDFINMLVPLGRILVAIATVVLVIVYAIMGVRWITANPEEQAKLKQQLIGLVVATIVIYGAVGIWTITKEIMEGLTTF